MRLLLVSIALTVVLQIAPGVPGGSLAAARPHMGALQVQTHLTHPETVQGQIHASLSQRDIKPLIVREPDNYWQCEQLYPQQTWGRYEVFEEFILCIEYGLNP